MFKCFKRWYENFTIYKVFHEVFLNCLSSFLWQSWYYLVSASESNLIDTPCFALDTTLRLFVVMYTTKSSAKSDPSTPIPKSPNIPLIATRKMITLLKYFSLSLFFLGVFFFQRFRFGSNLSLCSHLPNYYLAYFFFPCSHFCFLSMDVFVLFFIFSLLLIRELWLFVSLPRCFFPLYYRSCFSFS